MLTATLYAALTGTALFAGFVDSIAGGGGLITVPALLAAGLPPATVLGTNKAQSCCGTALATFRYHRAGLFALRPNLAAVGAVLVGATLGAEAVQHFDTVLLSRAIPVLLVAVAAYTLLSPKMHDHCGAPRISRHAYLPIAGTIGAYDGFFGPGTGSFFAASLVSLRSMGLTRATGLTKLFNLTSNAASVIVFAVGGKIVWTLALCMATGSMTGAWIGSHFATRHGARLIRPLLIAVSLALTAKLILGW